MKTPDETIEPSLAKNLNSLQSVPERDPEAAARGRANFLSQASALAGTITNQQAISPNGKVRHTGWVHPVQNLFSRKEPHKVLPNLISIFVLVAVIFGSAGASVFAAQDSLPGDPLYGVKLASESGRLGIGTTVQTRMELNLEFAGRRVEEIRAFVQTGRAVPETLPARLQQHLETELQLAAGLNDKQLGPALEQVQLALRNQEQALEQVEAGAPSPAEPGLIRARQVIHSQLQLVMLGLEDPAQFRFQVGNRGPAASHTPAGRMTATCAAGGLCGGGGLGPQRTPTPGSGYREPGPHPSQTPTGAGYRTPGPHPSQTPTVKAYGTPGPHGTGTPGAKATCTCTPQATNPGPQMSQTPGGGTGSGPQPSSTCTPKSGPATHTPGANPSMEPGGGGGEGGGSTHQATKTPVGGGGGGGTPQASGTPQGSGGGGSGHP